MKYALLIMVSLLGSQVSAAVVQRTQLDHGVVVIVEPVHTTDLVAVRVAVRAGPAYEGPLLGSGVSDTLGRVLVDAISYVPAVARPLGEAVRVQTNQVATTFSVVTTSNRMGDAIAQLAAIVRCQAYDDASVMRILERPVTVDPIGEALDLLAFRVHSARFPVAGLPRLRGRLNADLLKRYQAMRYSATNTTVTVVGHVDAASVLALTQAAFAELPSAGLAAATITGEPAQLSARTAQVAAPVPQVCVAWRLGESSSREVLQWPFVAAWVEQALRARGLPVQVSLRTGPGRPGMCVVRLATAQPDVDQPRLMDALVTLSADMPTGEAWQALRDRVRQARAERLTDVRERAAEREWFECAVADPAAGDVYAQDATTLEAASVAAFVRSGLGRSGELTVTLYAGPQAESSSAGPRLRSGLPPILAQVPPEIITLPSGVRVVLRTAPQIGSTVVAISLGGGQAAELDGEVGAAAAFQAIIATRAGVEPAGNSWRIGWSIQGTPERAEAQIAAVMAALHVPITEVDAQQVHGPTTNVDPISLLLHETEVACQVINESDEQALANDATVIEAYRRRVVQAANMVIAITGTGDREALLDGVASGVAAANLPMGEPWTWPAFVPERGPDLRMRTYDGSTGLVALAWPASGLRDTDLRTRGAVLLALVAGGKGDLTVRFIPHPRRSLWVVWAEADAAALDNVHESLQERVQAVRAAMNDVNQWDDRRVDAAIMRTEVSRAFRQERSRDVVADWCDRVVAGCPLVDAPVDAADQQALRRAAETWLAAEPYAVIVRPRPKEIAP